MPYPMVQMPTWSDFQARLTGEFKCTFGTQKFPAGTTPLPSVPFVARVVNGTTYRCVFDMPAASNTRVALSVLRSICAKLRIDPAAFGLVLG
ncbi:MAG: hypothetical protein E6J67_20905 [Deltaproteobacteria bacterium]|nr:MAG: hypothetical protein E6J67_20905 [Deltaproteobacteria bacterium]